MPNDKDKKLLPWGPEKKLKWFIEQRVQRSYRNDVLLRLEALPQSAPSLQAQIEQYGSLTIDPSKFPLFAVRVGNGSRSKKNILITGGVHGYETSGVKGALLFLEKHAQKYSQNFNFLVFPCISPWSYETINRLDPIMENPNREFKDDGRAEESLLVMHYLNRLGLEFDAHIDLHETTDSDRVFLPEEFSKNGLALDARDVDIPDGFYLIGTKGFVRPELEKRMIESVREVTHIAKPSERGTILDMPVSHEGVIHGSIPGICAEFTSAKSRLGAYTTEVYPDSPHFKSMGVERTEAVCKEAQVACLRGALDFWSSETH